MLWSQDINQPWLRLPEEPTTEEGRPGNTHSVRLLRGKHESLYARCPGLSVRTMARGHPMKKGGRAPETSVQYVQGPGSMSKPVIQPPALWTSRTQEDYWGRHTSQDKGLRGTRGTPGKAATRSVCFSLFHSLFETGLM